MHRSGLAFALTFVAAAGVAAPAAAHNSIVHRDMTERAYEVLLAVAAGEFDDDQIPDLPAFKLAAAEAVRKLEDLPSGLPPPRQARCADPAAIKVVGSADPNWGSFENMALGAVPYPIKTTYATGNDCGVDGDWRPGAFFDGINGANGGPRDRTGVILGFWAHQPDDEVDDWHIFGRTSNVAGLSVIKSYLEAALGATGGTVWVTVRCAVTCLADAATLGIVGDCKECLEDAVAEAKKTVHEGLTTIDGVFPGVADHTSADFYTGMGHHLNVRPATSEGPWKLHPDAYDDLPGLLVENAGPVGIPDGVEFLAMGAADGLGLTVHYGPSLGPDRYETTGAADAHPDSVHRGEAEWEWLAFPHTPFTPLDNLAFYGWREFRDDEKHAAPPLGWPLHAFGDAIVPMHVTGTFGWGHRPYEDAFESCLTEYLPADDPQLVRTRAVSVLRRALVWRRRILDWRALHPERGADVPIRDLITRLAETTRERIESPTMLAWPLNPVMSGYYLVPGPTQALALAYYEHAPGAAAVNRDLLEEGIAAEVAFLVSAMEVVP